jgi:acylphosphatase
MTEFQSKHQRLRAVIHGRVQGVNFRAYTRRRAVELGLTGWVRNLPGGNVETVAEGAEESLLQFSEFLHEGSPSASVTCVDEIWQYSSLEFTDFQIRYF